MYLRQQPTPAMQPQPAIFNQPYQQGPQNIMMPPQAPNVAVNQSWVNPNPTLSMENVTINSSGAISNLPRPTSSRQLPQNRGPAYHNRMEHNNFESNALPQLSIGDLQCLDTVPQASEMNPLKTQPLFQMHHQREELVSEPSNQNHQGSQNHGFQTTWPNFNTGNPVQSTFNGAVPGGGGGSQGLGSFSFLEGMEGDDFIKGLVGGTSQTGFQLKQEPQTTVGQETHAPLMQSPRESQGNTYTNLLPRAMSNGSHIDPVRQDANQSLKNLQNPYSHNSMATDIHYPTLADWIKATRHSE